VPGWRNWQTR